MERHGRGDGAVGDEGLLCPTCSKPMLPAGSSRLVEPIPERRPMPWVKPMAAASALLLFAAGLLFGGYRYGLSRQPTTYASLEPSSGVGGTAEETHVPSASVGASDLAALLSKEPSTGRSGATSPSAGSTRSAAGSSTPGYSPFTLDLPGITSGGSSEGGTRPGSTGGTEGRPRAGELDLTARATIKASSVLAPAKGNDYGTDNLTDGKRDTCWSEGVAGYGIGQRLDIDFGRTVSVSRIEVLPGYDKHNEVDRWYSNGRLKTATLRFDDGSTRRMAFEDSKSFQSSDLPPTKTRKLTIVIDSVFPAKPGKNAAEDTSISELHVYGR